MDVIKFEKYKILRINKYKQKVIENYILEHIIERLNINTVINYNGTTNKIKIVD